MKYLIVCIWKGLPPNDRFHTTWNDWPGGRYIGSSKNDPVRIIEVDADSDEAATQAARTYEIWNRTGEMNGCPELRPFSELPLTVLSIHRVDGEVQVDGTQLRDSFLAEMKAERKRREEQAEREQLAKLQAKYGGGS